MPLFNRKPNQRVRFATNPEQQGEQPDGQQPEPAMSFTVEQVSTLLEALNLEPDATPDDVVAAVTSLAEQPAEQQGDGEQVNASRRRQPVLIDGDTWADMQDAVKLGLRTRSQEKRIAAEQVVDQAIRLGKASASSRETLIQQYNLDPEKTTAKLSNMHTIPRFETGYSRDVDFDADPEPNGWVR